MTPPTLLTIGQLARRTGVPVRTIRFWSDAGVLPETDRSGTGYRRYDARAVARLELVRTLRDLGLRLDDVRLVLDRRRSVAEVAAAHVDAIDAQIRALRTQRAVCTLLASPEAGALVARLAPGLDAAARARAADRIATFSDARVERYWALLGTLNGWPARPSQVPAMHWLAAALRA